MKKDNTFISTTYNMLLGIILIGLTLFSCGLMVYFYFTTPDDDLFGVCFIIGMTLILYAIMFVNGYEYFCSVEILPDRLIFHAPFHKSRNFLYTEIVDIGVDYGVISGTRFFYIYVGKTKIPNKYRHNITRLKFTKNTMKIQYRRNVYDAMLKALPPKTLGKTLRNSESLIRLYKLDDED